MKSPLQRADNLAFTLSKIKTLHLFCTWKFHVFQYSFCEGPCWHGMQSHILWCFKNIRSSHGKLRRYDRGEHFLNPFFSISFPIWSPNTGLGKSWSPSFLENNNFQQWVYSSISQKFSVEIQRVGCSHFPLCWKRFPLNKIQNKKATIGIMGPAYKNHVEEGL